MAEAGNGDNYNVSLHLKNLPSSAAEDEVLQMYLENLTETDEFSIEYSNSLEEALVHFQNLSIDDAEKTKDRIRQKPLLGNVLSVDDMHLQHRILVTNLKPAINDQLLSLYFEQRKFNPTEAEVLVEIDDVHRVAIITYADPPVLDLILTMNHSKTLGPAVVVEKCKYFDLLSNFAAAAAGAAAEEETADVGMAGHVAADYPVAREEEGEDDGDDVRSVCSEIAPGGRGGSRGRRRGRRPWRGGQHGGRGERGTGRGGGRGERGGPVRGDRTVIRGERVAGSGDRGAERGERISIWESDVGLESTVPGENRGRGRGRRAGGDVYRQYSEYGAERRPYSGVGRSETFEQDYVHHDNSGGHRRGGNVYNRGRGSRRGDNVGHGGYARGAGHGPQRADSVPSLLDQQVPAPPGSAHKEIEVKNEVNNEKCRLLVTMIRLVKRCGCNAFVDMRRHSVVLNGPESAITAASEVVYQQLINMHSLSLQLPGRFARVLDTQGGRSWCVDFMKNAQMCAIYYSDGNGNPFIIAADEVTAHSAAAQLLAKIKTEAVPFTDAHRSYLDSPEWTNFVTSAERNWLVDVEVTLSSGIRVIGTAENVAVAADNIRSQLSSAERQSRRGTSSRAAPAYRHVELPTEHQNQAQSQEENLEQCLFCGDLFPKSCMSLHMEECSTKSRTCPVCQVTIPAGYLAEDFQVHVDSHFWST